LNKDFTSAKITTRQHFTYGRFEIRAALPEGKNLQSTIYMVPKDDADWALNGQITIMTDRQTFNIESGLFYGRPEVNTKEDKYLAKSNLNDFHTYAIEWNQF